MNINNVLGHINTDTLTCSLVAELFAQSPYAQQGELVPDGGGKRYPTPHAHMHMRDGFEILPPPSTSETARLQAYNALDKALKKKVWEESFTQLYPEPQNVQVYSSPQEKLALKDTDVGIDKNMLAFDHSYNRRSGLQMARVDAVTQTTQYVKVPVMGMKGRPDRVRAPDQTQPLLLSTWTGTAYHDRLKQDGVCKDGININPYWLDKPEVTIVSPALPEIKSNPHSVFEDSESAIMTLTAALKSTAGVKVLQALIGQPQSVTFAIQSRTAVRALHAAVNANATWNTGSQHSKRGDAVQMIDRTQQLGADRSFTGTYTLTPKDITFTCTILGLINTNELLIVTHYPVAGEMTNVASSGVTTGHYDLAETAQTSDGGVFVGVAIDDPLPALSW